MLEAIIVVNVALCIIFGTALIIRNYDIPRILGKETKTLGIVILLILAFALNFTPLVSAEDSDGDGVEDALDECPDI